MEAGSVAELNGLLSPSAKMRCEAVRQLGERREAQAVETLCRVLQHDRSRLVRAAAARALAGFDGQPVVDALAAALSDPATTVRSAAALSLGRMEDAAALPALLPHLEHLDRTPALLCAVVVSNADDEALMRRLIDLAVQNKGLLRRNAILVLRSLLFECNLRRGPEVLAYAFAMCAEPLFAALRDEDPLTRAYAVMLLGDLGNAAALDALLPLVRDASEYVRSCLILALRQIGDARAVPALTWMRDHDSGEVTIHYPGNVSIALSNGDEAALALRQIQQSAARLD